jgi:asparagine synthase (glutamine-hydrolysing)
MCGLTGLFTERPYAPDELGRFVTDMANTLVHRGPDDSGTWVHPGGGVALGFRRLAIIDLSEHGHQPMRSASGRFIMVFNGEVYNYLELRRELEQNGARFRGHSDTETILAAFEAWGIAAAVRRFVGMFAMGVWDERDRSLTLIRDRLGIKPLFVYRRAGHVMFASELKAIMAGPGFDAELNGRAIEAYLQYLYVPAPDSIFAHVFKLLPGHMITFQTPGQSVPKLEAYWSLSSAVAAGAAHPFDGSDDEAEDELERVLSEAVRLRLIADVPVGALLSGGIDSSLVTALAQRHSSRALRTFSVGFDVPEYNEAPAAAAVARHLGTAHTELVVQGADMLELVPRLPDLFDEPLADASQLPTLIVSQMARKEVTVALSGDGGDEVFGGYHRYIEGVPVINWLTQFPVRPRRLIGAAAGRISTDSWQRAYRLATPLLPNRLQHRLGGEKLVKLTGLMQHADATEMYRYLLSQRGFSGDSPVPEGDPLATHFAEHADAPLLHRMMFADQMSYLPDDLLAKVDRASMAVSLEVRVPVLDHRVVELGWRFPAHLKIRGSQGKVVMRRLLQRYVPSELVDRPKSGFTVPLAVWLRGPLRSWAEDLLFDTAGTAVGSALDRRRVWERLLRGHTETANALWAVLMLESWRRRWKV